MQLAVSGAISAISAAISAISVAISANHAAISAISAVVSADGPGGPCGRSGADCLLGLSALNRIKFTKLHKRALHDYERLP